MWGAEREVLGKERAGINILEWRSTIANGTLGELRNVGMVVTGSDIYQVKLWVLLGSESPRPLWDGGATGDALEALQPLLRYLKEYSVLCPCVQDKDRLWWSCKLLEICPKACFCEGDICLFWKRCPSPFHNRFPFFNYTVLMEIWCFNYKNISNNNKCWISTLPWTTS